MDYRNIVDSYLQSFGVSERYKKIKNLTYSESQNYKQIKNQKNNLVFREKLMSLLDSDNRKYFLNSFQEWSKYGVSINTIEEKNYFNFIEYYDEIMFKYAIKKELYHKLDFSAQLINSLIMDKRCLDSKLSPMHIFKAAYQLGEPPAVSNFRFIFNSGKAENIKFRE